MSASSASVVRADSSIAPPPRWAPILISAIAALLYLPTVRFEFVYDDNSQIVANPLIQSWKNLPLLFHTDVWRFQNPLVVGHFWRPVFMSWLLLNHALFGLNTVAWHTAAVALYAASVYLVYRLVERIAGDGWLAALAALIFAVHPTHLETVAWVSGATDSLLCIFMIASLLCAIRAAQIRTHRHWLWMAFSLVLFALALLTKETAIVEPALIAGYLLLFAKSERKWLSTTIRLIPFLLIALAYLVLRNAVLGGFAPSYLHLTFSGTLITIPALLWFYLKHLLWPVGLSAIYDVSPVTQLGWSNFWWPLCATVVCVCTFIFYVVRSRDRVAMFTGLLLFLPLLPVMYIPVLEPGNFLHDRYLYLPSIGFAMLLAIALRHVRFPKLRLFGGVPAFTATAAALVVLGCAIATSRQQVFWANDVLLFSRATEIAPASETAFNNLGTALAIRGHRREARFAFEQVIRRNPSSWRAQYNLGLGYFLDGKYPEAEVYLQKSVELNPLEGDPAAVLAETRIRQGKFAAAEPAILHAIAVKPYKPGYRRVLALSLEGQGKLKEAIQAAEAELARNPADPETRALEARLKEESVPN